MSERPQPGTWEHLTRWEVPKSKLEAITGRPIPEEVWEFHPVGPRLVIQRQPPERQIGSIVVPDSIAEANPATTGWVVKVGPTFGDWEEFPLAPQEMPGRLVLFGQYSGIVLHESDSWAGAGYESLVGEFIIINQADILGVIG